MMIVDDDSSHSRDSDSDSDSGQPKAKKSKGGDGGNDDGDDQGDQEKMLPSKSTFLVKSARSGPLCTYQELTPLALGQCRDGINAPPLIDLERLTSLLFTNPAELREIGIEADGDDNMLGQELSSRNAIVCALMSKAGMALSIPEWLYSFSHEDSTIKTVTVIPFPVTLNLTPTTTVTFAQPTDVMRGVLESACQCSKRRPDPRPSTSCFTCSMTSNGTVEGSDKEQFKNKTWEAAEVLSAVLIAYADLLLLPFEAPSYGSPTVSSSEVREREFHNATTIFLLEGGMTYCLIPSTILPIQNIL